MSHHRGEHEDEVPLLDGERYPIEEYDLDTGAEYEDLRDQDNGEDDLDDEEDDRDNDEKPAQQQQ